MISRQPNLSPQTLENRNSTLKALYKQMDCHRPLFDSEEGYWWLANVEQVMKAATHKPDGSLKCLNSVNAVVRLNSRPCPHVPSAPRRWISACGELTRGLWRTPAVTLCVILDT
eukprot:COSAG01_NODE_12833_length_1678_cov_10.228626_1_plen_114_part_00